MARKYVPYTEKHKKPKGFGSLCPHELLVAEPQQMLERAIPVPGVGAKKLWVASGRWCFCVHPSPGAGADAWHGFPVIGGTVDERVWRALFAAGVVTRSEVRALRTQTRLPGA